jgi:hypothetical protein
LPAEALRPVSLRIRARISFAVANAVTAQILGHVQIGFIERERFYERGEIGKDGVDLARDRAVNLEAWWHEHQFGTLSRGRRRRHGRVHTVGPGLVARCGHDASFGTVANRDRAAPKVRVVALFNRRIERVHVDVDDLAHRHALTISDQEQKRN